MGVATDGRRRRRAPPLHHQHHGPRAARSAPTSATPSWSRPPIGQRWHAASRTRPPQSASSTPAWGWGTAFVDMDGDGCADLYAVQGMRAFIGDDSPRLLNATSALFLADGSRPVRALEGARLRHPRRPARARRLGLQPRRDRPTCSSRRSTRRGPAREPHRRTTLAHGRPDGTRRRWRSTRGSR